MNQYDRRIYKYELKPDTRDMIQMPKGAEILSVGRQGPIPYLWAMVDPKAPNEARIFRTVTTGEWFNAERLFYHGHVKLGGEKEEEGWYEMFVFEVETAIIPLEKDIVEDRFADDRAEIKAELKEAVAA